MSQGFDYDDRRVKLKEKKGIFVYICSFLLWNLVLDLFQPHSFAFAFGGLFEQCFMVAHFTAEKSIGFALCKLQLDTNFTC